MKTNTIIIVLLIISIVYNAIKYKDFKYNERINNSWGTGQEQFEIRVPTGNQSGMDIYHISSYSEIPGGIKFFISHREITVYGSFTIIKNN